MAPEHVAVTFGGPSAEHDISILTGLQCQRLLDRRFDSVRGLYQTRTGEWFEVPADGEASDYLSGPPTGSVRLEVRLGAEAGWYRKKGLRYERLPVSAILNCFHGGLGEGGGSQSLFQAIGVPATGGTVAAAALGMDKLAFGAVMAAAGVPTLPRVLLSPTLTQVAFEGPYIVKPRFGGSSIGIEVVRDLEAANALAASSPFMRQGAVLEPFRSTVYDLNVAFRTYPRFEVSEIERPASSSAQSGGIYSYEEKYLRPDGLDAAPREMPAVLSSGLRDRIRELAKDVAALTQLTGIVRVDLLSDGEEVFVNEVNSIPGAMAMYLWPEVDRAQLLVDMISEAVSKPSTQGPVAYSTGVALRAAGGIASKLGG